MSWIKRHPLIALGALALLLRASCALVTEHAKIFPAYYYTDATFIHSAATQALDDIRAGSKPHPVRRQLCSHIQIATTLLVYRAFGTRTLAINLANAICGALAVISLAWALGLIFPASVALTAGLLMAAWPSDIFYTSQNLKESPVHLFSYLALGAAFTAARDIRDHAGRSTAFAAASVLFLIGAGLYRSYVISCLSVGLLLCFLLMSMKRPSRTGGLLGGGAVLLALSLYPWTTRRIILAFEPPSGALSILDSHDIESTVPGMIPVTYDEFEPGKVNRPTSPAGITDFRKSRQFADRRWAKLQGGCDREIGTQIYPDAEFKTWTDILLYLPKGAFTVLFMPLPGLYPMDGKLGRYCAAAENIFLLLIAFLATVGITRTSMTPAHWGLLAFFALMISGASLLEFDLGSSGRHKLLYMPVLFPFAAEEILRLLGRKKEA